MRGISSLAENRSVLQEGLCSMDTRSTFVYSFCDSVSSFCQTTWHTTAISFSLCS